METGARYNSCLPTCRLVHIAVFRESDRDLILPDGGYALDWPLDVEYPNLYFGVSAMI